MTEATRKDAGALTEPRARGPAGDRSKWRKRLTVPIVFVIIWSLAGGFGLISPLKGPPPWLIVPAAADIGWLEILKALGVSLRMVFAGFFLGGITGTLVGLIFGYSALARGYFEFSVDLIRPIPVVALIPLFLLWFGIGMRPQIALVTLGIFLIMTIQTIESIRNVPDIYVRAALTNGASGFHIYRTVVLPAIVPHLLAGVRLAVASAWGLDVAAEFSGSQNGIGFMMITQQLHLDTAGVLVGIVIFGVLAAAGDAIVKSIAERLTRWSPRAVKHSVVGEILGR